MEDIWPLTNDENYPYKELWVKFASLICFISSCYEKCLELYIENQLENTI